MRFGLGSMGAMPILAVFVPLACGSSGNGPAAAQAGDASVCADTTGGANVTASIDDVFNNNPGLACPLDGNSVPLPYDTAIDTSCAALNMTRGDIQFGQCLDYLVWEVDLDASGHDLSKCFYDVKTHALVGVLYGDGAQDQCGGTSFTIQAGAVEACSISGLSAPGAGGLFEDCSPRPDGGGG